MSSRNQHFLVHPATDGLDSSLAPTLLGITTPGALTVADNVEYDISGARKKRPGTTRYNTTAVSESGVAVPFTNFSDFWRYGTGRTPNQKYVATAGTGIWKDDGDGVWDSLLTGWGTSISDTCITIAQGYAVFSNNNGTDAPQTWDQTTLAALGGTPPTFSFSVYHLRRLWVAGAAANMSRVNFSAAGDIATWSGGDSSNLIFDEDDGDAVVGISQPLHGRLYVFKGPNRGSVHEVSGSTFSTFTRNSSHYATACVGHRSIITTPNDIYWASLAGFHSLSTTQKFGDTEQHFLSSPIQAEFRDINFARVNQIQGFYHPLRNLIGWIVPQSGQTQNTRLFVYNLINTQWAIWTFGGFNPSCVNVARDSSTSVRLPRLYIGDYTGRVHSGDQVTLSDDDGTVAYTARIRTPVYTRMNDVDEMTEKSLSSIVTFFKPKGNYSADLNVVTDTRSQDTTVSMQGAGAILNSFVLNTDLLGSNELTYTETPFEDRARSIQLTYSVTGAAQDMEIVGYGVRLAPGETNAVERS